VNKKHKILIVLSDQFGYHTDTLMYCKYIDKSLFEIHYIGFDLGYSKFEIADVTVHYIPCSRNKLIRNLRYLTSLNKINRQYNFDLVFHIHTKFSLIIRIIFWWNKYIFDIRTGDLSDNVFLRQLKNNWICILSALTRHTSVISEGLANELNIKKYKRHIIPLGGEMIPIAAKDFSSMSLLYIGALSKRNIHETITGLALFFKTNNKAEIVYDIVGSGSKADINKLNETISMTGLKMVVNYHGFIKYTDLPPFLQKGNIGVVYIPQKDYYQHQPSTKLYEFLLSGMPIIATNTIENRLEVNDSCGVLCEDNPLSFSLALQKVYQNRLNYKSEEIRKQKAASDWGKIVKENLEPYFLKVISN